MIRAAGFSAVRRAKPIRRPAGKAVFSAQKKPPRFIFSEVVPSAKGKMKDGGKRYTHPLRGFGMRVGIKCGKRAEEFYTKEFSHKRIFANYFSETT